MASQDLNRLVKVRGIKRSTATRVCNQVDSDLLSYSVLECKEKIKKLQELSGYFKTVNETIGDLSWQAEQSDENLAAEIDACEEYDDKINSCILKLESQVTNIQTSTSDPNGMPQNSGLNFSAQNSVFKPNHIKLPQLPLPKYSHSKGENLNKFFQNFETIVDKYCISDFEKFVLLQGQLSKEPSTLLKSLQGQHQSYAEAKKLLEDAFASPEMQRFETIKRLSKLKLGSACDPYEFISEVKMLIHSFSDLGINSDMVLQYFIWEAMPEELRKQFIHITNEIRPDLSLIDKHIFSATERYMQGRVKTTETPDYNSTEGYATAINLNDKVSKFNICELCKNSGKGPFDHSISKCPVFKTAHEKVEVIKKLGFCIRCGYSNHKTGLCKFSFRKNCIYCNGQHFSFLCLANKSKNSATGVNKTSKKDIKACTSNTTASMDCNMQLENSPNSIILPTVSLKLQNGYRLRSLVDSASQSNFILEEVANKFKFKILKQLNMTVNGINSSASYQTKVVEFYAYFGSTLKKVVALTKPSITTNLKLRNLDQVISGFKNKGYKLADDYLEEGSNGVNNIELILGAQCANLLPDKKILFGEEQTSIYSETAMGVMLMGCVDTMVRDLPLLPKSNFCSYSTVADLHKSESLVSDTDIVNSNLPFRVDHSFELFEKKSDSFCDLHLIGDEGQIFPTETSVNFCVTDPLGNLVESELYKAVNAVSSENSDYLFENCNHNLNLHKFDHETCIENENLSKFALENISRNSDGRLIVPLLWNEKVSPHLAKNFNLSKQILKSSVTKLSRDPEKLNMVDEVFQEQLRSGVIEKISNPSSFVQDPEVKFIAHMPIFKMKSNTTKCRVVYLANVSEKGQFVNHNQALQAGPNLNKKITSALLHMRMDKYIFIFDIIKAFLQLALYPEDSKKLCFLWLDDPRDINSVAIYRMKRLMFGLRCSPCLLMLALYHILIIDTVEDCEDLKNLKLCIWNLIFMDNGCFSANSPSELKKMFLNLETIFSKYKIYLQEFHTNCEELSSIIGSIEPESLTESECLHSEPEKPIKLLGLNWHSQSDELSTVDFRLDPSAKSKREILSSIAKNYDVLNINGPVLNRARLFMHDLQLDRDLTWDDALPPARLKQWSNICKQINKSPSLRINRFVGRRDDYYKLVCFTDSSACMFGAVVFIEELDTGNVNFLLSKNRLVTKSLETKSMPSMELQAIVLGVETLHDTYQELCGDSCVIPIKIKKLELHTDSAVCLNWIISFSHKIDKMNKQSVFVKNRLNRIEELCAKQAIEFSHCAGKCNPADFVTRPTSYKQLLNSNYLNYKLSFEPAADSLRVVVPNPKFGNVDSLSSNFSIKDKKSYLVDPGRCSTFKKVLNVYTFVLKFVQNLKRKLRLKDPIKFVHLEVHENLENFALKLILSHDQENYLLEVFGYFSEGDHAAKMPDLVARLNLFIDGEGLIRVKHKLKFWRVEPKSCPILLPKNSRITSLIIENCHKNLSHAGTYTMLSELRKIYYVSNLFSQIKKCLKSCLHCRRFNAKPIALNQSPYRDFRISPSNIVFRSIFIDHMGPFVVTFNAQKFKIYVLIVTCLWSRAVNLLISPDMTVKSFLKAFQQHVYAHGIPEVCLSDCGSSIVQGATIMSEYLNDEATKSYFKLNGIKTPNFSQYPKGKNELGGLVESCVKIVKRLISGSIRNLVLEYFDFYHLIQHVIHLANRRPVALKSNLRDPNYDYEWPSAITPEILVKGYELISVDLIPELAYNDSTDDPDFLPISERINSSHENLLKARKILSDIYSSEFQSNLLEQATNKVGRYRKFRHEKLKVGDLVLIRDPFIKPNHFPMAKVLEISTNSLDEVTEVLLLKGKSGEKVRRHVNSLILYLSRCEEVSNESTSKNNMSDRSLPQRPQRAAAVKARQKLRNS